MHVRMLMHVTRTEACGLGSAVEGCGCWPLMFSGDGPSRPPGEGAEAGGRGAGSAGGGGCCCCIGRPGEGSLAPLYAPKLACCCGGCGGRCGGAPVGGGGAMLPADSGLGGGGCGCCGGGGCCAWPGMG